MKIQTAASVLSLQNMGVSAKSRAFKPYLQVPLSETDLKWGAIRDYKKVFTKRQIATMGAGLTLTLLGALVKSLGWSDTVGGMGLGAGILVLLHLPIVFTHYAAKKYGEKEGIKSFLESISRFEDVKELLLEHIGPKLDKGEIVIYQDKDDRLIVEQGPNAKADVAQEAK